jgi:hypothetical protein
MNRRRPSRSGPANIVSPNGDTFSAQESAAAQSGHIQTVRRKKLCSARCAVRPRTRRRPRRHRLPEQSGGARRSRLPRPRGEKRKGGGHLSREMQRGTSPPAAEAWTWENAAAGAAAGFATVAALHPLDVVRTRFQGNPSPRTIGSRASETRSDDR